MGSVQASLPWYSGNDRPYEDNRRSRSGPSQMARLSDSAYPLSMSVSTGKRRGGVALELGGKKLPVGHDRHDLSAGFGDLGRGP